MTFYSVSLDPRYKHVALDLAKQAGEIMLRYFKLGIATEWKNDSTPVTAADQAVNDLVVKTIREHFPEHGIIAEEGGTNYTNQAFAWVCDPIDGTRAFAWGAPLAHFSLALVREGQPIFAVVHDPYTERMYVAERGKGALLNDVPIHCSSGERMQGGKYIIGTMHWPDMVYPLWKAEPALLAQDMQTFTLPTVVGMGMLLARGMFDGLFFAGDCPWDCAAIQLIVEEAGGKVTDLFGEEQRYDGKIRGIIASNGKLHDTLVKIIRENGALDGV